MTRPSTSRLISYGAGVVLGIGAAGLSRSFSPPILTNETPQFVFGTALVLFGFLRFGPGPGLLAGLIHSLAILPAIDPLERSALLGVIAAVPILEAWSVWWLNRWTRSLVAASVAFWLGIGWAVDGIGYGLLGGLSFDYLSLLYVKHLLNGVVCALLAELGWLALPARWRGGESDPTLPIRAFALGRLFLLALPPTVLLSLLYLRVSFQGVIGEVQATQQGHAAAVTEAIRDRLAEGEAALALLIGQLVSAGDQGEAHRTLLEFHRARPEYVNLAVVDSAGRVRDASPERALDGRPLAGIDVSGRSYFREVRARGRPVYAPLVRGLLQIRRAAPEPVVITALPIVGPSGRFTGALVAALDVANLVPLLEEHALGAEVTLIDQDRKVIASTISELPPGADLGPVLPASVLRQASGTFRYSLSADRPPGQFQFDLRHAAYQRVEVAGWGVIVDRLSTSLHSALLPVAGQVLAGFALLMGLIGFFATRVSRGFAEPLLVIADEARRIASGRPGGDQIGVLRRHEVDEVRELGADFERMADAVSDRFERSRAREGEFERRFQAAFENPVVGMLHVEPSGRVLRVNDRLCRIVGRSREEIVARPFGLPFPPDAREAVERDLKKVAEGEVSALYREDTLPGGTTIRAVISAADRDDGTPAFLVLAIEDLTGRKDLERQLVEAQRLEAIGLLAGGVAHDFNNLLTPILGYVGMAREALPPDSPVQRDLEPVMKAANRARELVRQLLAFGRRQTLEVRRVDPVRLLEDFQAMLLPVLPGNVMVELDLGADLGAVEVDPAQLEQVLMNLALNAIDAMPAGGRLTIAARRADLDAGDGDGKGLRPGRYLAIEVHDTGEGIEERDLERLFEPFFTTKAPGKGTGLGLAMVHGIVAQHHGAVRVTSAPGRGSVFTVLLPGSDRPVAERPRGSRQPPLPRPGGTVLLAEDEPGVRGLVKAALTRQGYRVLAAASGEEAIMLEQECDQPISLLLTDVVMPGMTGPQLFDRLILSRPGLKVLYLSGFAGDELGSQGIVAAEIAFLQKPFTAEELLARVAALAEPAGRS